MLNVENLGAGHFFYQIFKRNHKKQNSAGTPFSNGVFFYVRLLQLFVFVLRKSIPIGIPMRSPFETPNTNPKHFKKKKPGRKRGFPFYPPKKRITGPLLRSRAFFLRTYIILYIYISIYTYTPILIFTGSNIHPFTHWCWRNFLATKFRVCL